MIEYIKELIYKIKREWWQFKAFSKVEFCPWNMMESYEFLFAYFQEFNKCMDKTWTEKAKAYEDDDKESAGYNNFHKEERIKICKRLAEIQKYIDVTRVENQKIYEKVNQEWNKSCSMFSEPSKTCKGYYELKFEHFYYLDLKFKFDKEDKLSITYKIVKEEPKNSHDLLEIEDRMRKIDKRYAIDLIKFSDYIWE